MPRNEDYIGSYFEMVFFAKEKKLFLCETRIQISKKLEKIFPTPSKMIWLNLIRLLIHVPKT